MFALSKVIYHVDTVEGEDWLMGVGRKEFFQKWETAGFMVKMTKLIWGMGKLVIMYIGFCDLKGLILMIEKSVLGAALIKKQCYWPKGAI